MKNWQYPVQSIIIFLAMSTTVGMGSVIPLNVSAVNISKGTLTEERYVVQKTEMSSPASPTVTPHGKLPHQIVFALPLRNDSRIWTGTVTFTASKPQSVIDAEHGEP